MEYLSSREIAIKWDVSERFVQQRCKAHRIEGAKKFNGVWMVPADAERPPDMRRNEAKATQLKAEVEAMPRHTPMPLMNAHFASGRMRQAVENIADEDERNIAWAEYYYYTGNAKEAVRMATPYLESPHLELRMSALFVYAFASLAFGDTKHTRRSMDAAFETFRALDKDAPRTHLAIVIFTCCAFDTLFHLPRSRELPELQEFVPVLPPGLRLFAAYVQARYGYLNGLHATAIGIAETALVLVEAPNPISGIYTHLLCAMSYMHTQYPQMAQRHLAKAWELAKPDDLIEPFGELHGELWGMLEVTIKKSELYAFQRMIHIAKYHANGWREVHNALTGDSLPTDLTPTEYTVAMLSARGWVYKEIAAHLDISSRTVKKYAMEAIQKTDAGDRQGLQKVMLPKHSHRR